MSKDNGTAWIPVGERLPEKRDDPYQVAAICAKKYDSGPYDGQGIRRVYQDWVIRQWPQNFDYWMPLPPLPESAK